jgi:O-antigen ligase
VTTVLQRRGDLFGMTAIALASAYAGLLVARNQQTMAMSLLALLALAGLVVLVNLPTELVFLSWLFLAPIFQNPADSSSLGRALTWALYTAPALLFLALTIARRQRVVAFRPIDALPAAYVAYVVLSFAMTTNVLGISPLTTGKGILELVALGPLVYYFLTFGPGIAFAPRGIYVALLGAALVQAVMAIVEIATGWNLWGDYGWLTHEGGARASGTLANPAVLGMLLGCGIVFAVAVLSWGGPRALRTPSWIAIGLCTPALFFTLTRGPMMATAAAVVLLLLLGRARLAGLAVLLGSFIVILLVMPAVERTSVYQNRFSVSSTVDIRVAISDVSMKLAAEKPVLGWGYNTFDEVKNASDFVAAAGAKGGVALSSVLKTTSHNTYLTIIVELGALGLLLYAIPFAVICFRAVMTRPPPDQSWIVGVALGSLLVIVLTAVTLDFRFFSFPMMLPFVFLAILRRTTAPARTGPQPASAKG